jgi:GNAT superfamily N-acetyltransferase
MKATLEREPAPADVEFVNARLREHNLLHAEDDEQRPLAVFVRDADDAIAGGLLGGTYWGWLYIDALWIREDARHAGHGGALLRVAEHEALRRGCQHAHLTTHDFQARPFYEKHGYTVFGQLADLPQGARQVLYEKDARAWRRKAWSFSSGLKEQALRAGIQPPKGALLFERDGFCKAPWSVPGTARQGR